MKVTLFMLAVLAANPAFADGVRDTPGQVGADGAIRQVPGHCGPDKETKNVSGIGPACVEKDVRWASDSSMPPCPAGQLCQQGSSWRQSNQRKSGSGRATSKTV